MHSSSAFDLTESGKLNIRTGETVISTTPMSANIRYLPNGRSFAESIIHAWSGSSTASTIRAPSSSAVPNAAANPALPSLASMPE